MDASTWKVSAALVAVIMGTWACSEGDKAAPGPRRATAPKPVAVDKEPAIAGPLTDKVALAILDRWTTTQNRSDAAANAALYADTVTAELRLRGRTFRLSRGPFLAQRAASLREGAAISTRNARAHVLRGVGTISFGATRRTKSGDESITGILTVMDSPVGPRIVREQLRDAIVAEPTEALPELLPSKFAFVITAGDKAFAILGASSAPAGSTEGPFETVSVTVSTPAAGAPGFALAARAPSKPIAWNNEGWAHKPFRAYGPEGSCDGKTGKLAVIRVASPPATLLRAWSTEADAQKAGAELWAWPEAKEFSAVELSAGVCDVARLAWAHIGDTRPRKPLSSMYPAEVFGPAKAAFLATPFTLDRTASFETRVPGFAWASDDFDVQVWGRKTQRMLVTVQGDHPSRCDAPSMLGLFAVSGDTYRPLSVVDGFAKVQMVVDVDGDGRMDLVGTDATGSPILVRQGATSLALAPSGLPGRTPECAP